MGEEYKELIQEFYRVYRPVQKKHSLRMSGHSGRDGSQIEIWEYDGERRKRCICKVKEEDEATCYRRAIEMLENYKGRWEDADDGRKAG